MSKYIVAFLAVFIALSSAIAKGPQLRLTLLVVNTDGKPVQGALTTLADERDIEHPASEATHTRSRGATDAQGKFTGEIETEVVQHVYFRVERNGYAPTKSFLNERLSVLNGRWEPWAQTVKVVLVKLPSADPDNESDKEPPTFPTDLRVTKTTADSIALKWKAARDNGKISGYIVYRDGQPVETKEPIRGTTYIDANLPEGEEFEYSVRAFDFAGNISHLSDPVMGKTAFADAESAESKQAVLH